MNLISFSNTANNEEKIKLMFDQTNNSTDTMQHIINTI